MGWPGLEATTIYMLSASHRWPHQPQMHPPPLEKEGVRWQAATERLWDLQVFPRDSPRLAGSPRSRRPSPPLSHKQNGRVDAAARRHGKHGRWQSCSPFYSFYSCPNPVLILLSSLQESESWPPSLHYCQRGTTGENAAGRDWEWDVCVCVQYPAMEGVGDEGTRMPRMMSQTQAKPGHDRSSSERCGCSP